MIGIKYVFIDVEIPIDKLESNVVYHCYNDRIAELLCPCGCKAKITLNLLEDTRPLWKINGNTISPSINRQVGCRSHFTITNGITH